VSPSESEPSEITHSVTVIGTLPPPHTGMTIATKAIVDHMAEQCELRTVNISHPKYYRGWRWRFIKALQSLRALGLLLLFPRHATSYLYTVANSGLGLWYNVAIALIARCRRYRLFLHHHVWSYVSNHDWRMALLNRLMGASGVHIMLCSKMVCRFRDQYKNDQSFLVLPNDFVLLSQERRAPSRCRGGFRLGHISNLSIEKGLDLVLSTFATLRDSNQEVSLILAGPLVSKRASRLLRDAQGKYPGTIDYRGATYGIRKREFFCDIDVFLFPTRYVNEAYPLVLTEALFYGVPVVCYDRGCIPQLVGESGGIVLDSSADFVRGSYPTLARWISDPEEFHAARDRASSRGRELSQHAQVRLEEVLSLLCQPETCRARPGQ